MKNSLFIISTVFFMAFVGWSSTPVLGDVVYVDMSEIDAMNELIATEKATLKVFTNY